MKSAVTLILGLLISAVAQDTRAEVDLRLYKKSQEIKEAKEILSWYVTGIGRGLHWYNEASGSHKSPQLFCIPSKLSLDQGLIESLLDQEIQSPANGKSYAGDTPIELILLRAFESRFPCCG